MRQVLSLNLIGTVNGLMTFICVMILLFEPLPLALGAQRI